MDGAIWLGSRVGARHDIVGAAELEARREGLGGRAHQGLMALPDLEFEFIIFISVHLFSDDA
jgi:hypothetical protein